MLPSFSFFNILSWNQGPLKLLALYNLWFVFWTQEPLELYLALADSMIELCFEQKCFFPSLLLTFVIVKVWMYMYPL